MPVYYTTLLIRSSRGNKHRISYVFALYGSCTLGMATSTRGFWSKQNRSTDQRVYVLVFSFLPVVCPDIDGRTSLPMYMQSLALKKYCKPAKLIVRAGSTGRGGGNVSIDWCVPLKKPCAVAQVEAACSSPNTAVCWVLIRDCRPAGLPTYLHM